MAERRINTETGVIEERNDPLWSLITFSPEWTPVEYDDD